MSLSFTSTRGAIECRWIEYALLRDNAQHHLEGAISEASLEALHAPAAALGGGPVQLDARALVGLCFYELGPRCFYGVRPVHAASDLEGLAVRVPRSGPWVRLVRGLGARPVAMPYEQIYPALKERTVDLAESNWQSFLASRHNEVARYFSLSEHMMTPGIVIFSRRTWDMLSPDEQVALRDAARESEMYMRGIWNQQRPGADTAPAGIEIVTDVDRRSFAEATVPLYQEQAATPQFQKMLQQIRDLAD